MLLEQSNEFQGIYMTNTNTNVPQITQPVVVTQEMRQRAVDEAVAKSQDLLAYSVYTLIYNHGFIGHLLQMLVRTFTMEIPTAAVGASDMRYVLYVNPMFYGALSKDEARAILQHEIYHLLNHHLARGKGYDPYMWNVAADLSINCYIKGLPSYNREETKQKMIKNYKMTEAQAEKELPKADKDGRCSSALMPKDYNLPENKTAEWYYKAIQENKELKQKFSKPAASQFDMDKGTTSLTPEEQEQLKQDLRDGKARFSLGEANHDKWEETNSNGQGNLMDEELKRMIREAMNKSPETFGNLPGDMREAVMKFLNSEINWKNRLRQFLQVATEVLRVNTRKRPSRRYGVTYPGVKTDYKLKIGFFVDSSGSMSNDDLAQSGAEINQVWETGLASVEVMVGDTSVNDHYPLKKKMEPKDFKVTGRGGTDSEAWMKYFAKQKHLDCLIVLTDGEFSYNLKNPGIPILWVLTQNGVPLEQFKQQIKFGKSIKITSAKDRK